MLAATSHAVALLLEDAHHLRRYADGQPGSIILSHQPLHHGPVDVAIEGDIESLDDLFRQ